LQILNLHGPEGTAWELFVVVVVIIAAPVLVERLRIPGMIGLLAGGCLIGPKVLGVVSDTSGILHDLGQVGLLYLMFLAGLELDLGVFARYRNRAIGFMGLTYFAPQILGTIGGFIVGYGVAGSILLGSVFASYTLVAYPIVRNMGLAGSPAVATAVGATVLTDTLALVVLAFISGSTAGDANGVELILQVVLGLAILVVFTFVVLPWIARWFFRTIGTQRTLRYVFMLAALLASGVVAEVVGIESIVGAFFCGLALNRLVPNEGEFMERIEFFGSALLIPCFLVSIGTVIDPAVLIDPGTLGLAGLFIVACIGGKLLAAVLCGPLFHFTKPEIGVVFGLSVAQAAATLAATFVGLEIGLFTTSTVNAVMIVIVVSLILASVSATRYGAQMPRPEADTSRFGRVVLAQVDAPEDARAVLVIAAGIAAADAGIVRPTFVVADGGEPPTGGLTAQVHREIVDLALDADLEVRHDRSVTDGLLNDAGTHGATMIVVPAMSQSWLPALLGAGQHALVAACPIPVALVRAGRERPTRVVLALSSAQAKRPSSAGLLAAALAARLAKSGMELVIVAADAPRDDLAALLGRAAASAIAENPVAWLEREGRASDAVVVPGGRNGAMATARATRQAVGVGATVVAAADRESVTTSELAAEGLAVVTRRAVGALP
jgi:Kef-type K+ transport system membrane component KefB